MHRPDPDRIYRPYRPAIRLRPKKRWRIPARPHRRPERPVADSPAAADLRAAGATPQDGFPALLRAARRAADLSQRQLADLVGAPRSAIGRAETTVSPRWETALNWFAACGCTVVVCDQRGHPLLTEPEGMPRDFAGRRYPAHLDTTEVVTGDEWWGWKYLTGPHSDVPYHSFQRDRCGRDFERVAGPTIEQ